MPEDTLLLADPWNVEPGDFPEAGKDDEKLLFLVNYGVLAPSILNVQPWRFRVADGSMNLFADRSRMLPVADPDGRELAISCGAALLNLRVAARSFGYELDVGLFPDPAEQDLLAQLKLRRSGEPSEHARRLRSAIPARRTHRAPFEARQPEQSLLDDLAEAARQEGAMLALIERVEDKRGVAELAAEAERIHLTDPEFRRELSAWLSQRAAEGAEPPRETGWGLGNPAGRTEPARDRRDLFVQTAASVAREFAAPETAAAQQLATVESSPILALLATDGDSAVDWIAAGQALERVLLTAALAGAAASYLNPPIEIKQLRRQLGRAFGVQGNPQVLLRIGYAQSLSPSPRRSTREVIA